MMIKTNDIIKFMEETAPPHLAEAWDNFGLLTGNHDKKIKTVITCLDVTDNVISEAVYKKADMIISHHPLIFSPLKEITDRGYPNSLLVRAVRENICIYSSHTALDAAMDGLNDYFAKMLDLTDIAELPKGTGRAGILKEPVLTDEFHEKIKKRLNTKTLKTTGPKPDMVQKAAVFSGSFDFDYFKGIKNDVDVIVTGEVKYHQAVENIEKGFYIIAAGHYETEEIVSKMLKIKLENKFKGIKVYSSEYQSNPFEYL